MCYYDIQLSTGALGEKKEEGLEIDVSSELVFLSKKRTISMDVSSGLLFLKKKKIKEELLYEEACFND